MKPKDQVEALAELDGIEFRPPIDGSKTFDLYVDGKYQYSLSRNNIRYRDYLNSYDAIIPLIQKTIISDHQWTDFYFDLPTGVAIWHASGHIKSALTATPEQLCEALLRATGKWKE